MTSKKPPESGFTETLAISADAEGWIRQFIKHFELHVLDASRGLSAQTDAAALQRATALALFATYLDSGMDHESALELLGQVAIESRSADIGWNDELNQRRFELIDREIQESLTPAECIELAGLTRMMRDHVDSELNLPMEGARNLHRKLLQIDAMGEPG